LLAPHRGSPWREAGTAHRGFGLGALDGQGTAAPERRTRDLEGEQSPWKERASRCWQRRHDDNGLVSGARPCSWPLCEGFDGPASACFGERDALPLRRRRGFGQSAPREASSDAARGSGGPQGGQPRGGSAARPRLALRRRPRLCRPCAAAPGASASRCTTRSMTWGSASADRSIIESDHSSRVHAPRAPRSAAARGTPPPPSGSGTPDEVVASAPAGSGGTVTAGGQRPP
jgi:hypothetical protein